MTRFLCWLLRLANAAPPHCHRDEFYQLKDRILRRHGRLVGHDWQEITRECYGCDGAGQVYGSPGLVLRCVRCDGTGVYDRFWVKLERWELAGRVFHRPAGRTWKRPEEPVSIVGYVRHADVGRAGKEACLWLALLLDRGLFVRLMGSSCACGPTWRYPLVSLQKVWFRLAMECKRIRKRRCVTCGGLFRQGPFRARRSICYQCRRCERDWERRAAVADDIPF